MISEIHTCRASGIEPNFIINYQLMSFAISIIPTSVTYSANTLPTASLWLHCFLVKCHIITVIAKDQRRAAFIIL